MKKDLIKSAMDNVNLNNETKERIKKKCYECEDTVKNSDKGYKKRTAIRIFAVAAAIAVMTIGAFATSKFIKFSMTKNDGDVKINASLSHGANDAEKPLRSWNSDGCEISVRLGFSYMPEDMSEDPTATHKWGGTEVSRAITFSGYDLRRSDLNTIIRNISSAEKFIAGNREAYLLIESGASVYNKDLYVLFEEEEIVVHASVGYGITVEEIKDITAGMSISVTEDINSALPIANEINSSDVPEIPFVFYNEREPVLRGDLLEIGETGVYESVYDNKTVRVDGVDIYDSISGFESNIYRQDFVKNFVDEYGVFVPYKRTEVLYSGDVSKGEKPISNFGETVEMTKRFVVLNLTVTSDEENIKPFMSAFSLGGLLETEEFYIERTQGRQNFVIDSTPGKYADTHEPVYLRSLGNGQWELGYILDADECEDELYFYNREADLHYVLNP